MSLTLPGDFQNLLESRTVSAVRVYELELDAATLYYSDQELTWGGNDYVALVSGVSQIVQQMGTRVPEVSVTFSNVNYTLMPHLIPSDLITGKRMVTRLLLRNAAGGLETDSVVEHIGLMERPRRIDDESLEIVSIGLSKGALNVIPARTTSPWCHVHKFADGVDCNYTSTTTTNGAYSGTSIVVVDASKFEDEHDRIGDHAITVGANSATLTNVTGNTLTVVPSISGSGGEAVAFVNCDRTYFSCQARAREFEYQGFRGSDAAEFDKTWIEENMQGIPNTTTWAYLQTVITGEFFWDGPTGGNWPNFMITNPWQWTGSREQEAVPLSRSRRAVPIIYGRRQFEGILVESSLTGWVSPTDLLEVRFYALSEGEIEELVKWAIDDEWQFNTDDVITSGNKTFGIYYRAGEIGANDNETEADYEGTPTVWKRSQNRDFLSGVNDTLSRTAYVSIMRRLDSDDPEIRSPVFDVKGVKVWRFTNSSTPTHDPADGPAKVWSQNPIWQVVDLMTNDRYGLGRIIEESDLDFTVIKDEADYCDTVIDGRAAIVGVIPLGNADDEYRVDTTFNLERGMDVIYDGASYTNESDTVTEVLGGGVVKLGTERASAAQGDTITPKIPRFTSNYVYTRQSKADLAILEILSTCNGYITYSAEGKIQIRVERDVSPTDHYKDVGNSPAAGYEIDSFRWLWDEGRYDPEVNRVQAVFKRQTNITSEQIETDFTHLESPKSLRTRQLALEAVDNAECARRLAEIEKLKSRLDPPFEFTAGPIGAKIQPGDTITVTYEDQLSSATARVFRTEATDDFRYRILCEEYDSTIYGSTTVAQPFTPAVANLATNLTLSVTSSNNSTVELSWTFTGNTTDSTTWKLYKSTSTMGTTSVPPLAKKIAEGLQVNSTATYLYSVPLSEIETLLYFVLVMSGSVAGPVISNEVTAVPVIFDPTDSEDEQGFNLVFDGGFNIPHQWSQAPAASTATVDPNASSAVAGGGYTDPANAYDNAASTTAKAQVGTTSTPGSPFEKTTKWTLPGSASNVTGYWRVTHRINALVPDELWQKLYWSDDDGSTSTLFASSIAGGLVEATSPVYTADRSGAGRAALLATTHNLADYEPDPNRGEVGEIDWIEISGAGAVAFVTGGDAYLRGDGATTYGEVKRPFPGASGTSLSTIADGDQYTVEIKYKQHTEGAASDPILVSLIDTDGTYQVLTSVAATEPDTTWRSQAECYTAGSTLYGPFQISVRTLSTNMVLVTEVMITAGCQIHAFTAHTDEAKKDPSNRIGTPDGYPKGGWNSSPKNTTVST